MTEVYLCDLDGTGSMHVCSKGDNGALPHVRADLARPVTVAELEKTRVGDIGNRYGGISIRCIDGKPEWAIEDYDGPYWEPCPIPVFLALRALSHEGGE